MTTSSDARDTTPPPATADPGRPLLTARPPLAVVAGLIVGALQLWSVLRVPAALEPLSNGALPWVLAALLVSLTARWTGEAVMLAVTTFLALVAGFYTAEAFRGFSVDRHQVVLWSVLSFVAGPLIGVAAGWIRQAGPGGRGLIAAALGAGAVGGLLAGEAANGLIGLHYTRLDAFWWTQFTLSVLVPVAWIGWRGRGRGLVVALAAGLAAGAGVAVATIVVFSIL